MVIGYMTATFMVEATVMASIKRYKQRQERLYNSPEDDVVLQNSNVRLLFKDISEYVKDFICLIYFDAYD